MGSNGIYSPNDCVTFFPGTEETGIDAETLEEGSPVRIGQTPQATWAEE